MKKIFAKQNLFILLILLMSFAQFSHADNTAGNSSGGTALTIVGEGITGAMGVYMGMKCPPTNYMACFMAAQCAMQLISSLGSQSSMNGVNGAYQAGNYSAGTAGTGNPNGGGGTSSATDGSGASGAHAANNAQTANTGALANLQKIQSSLSSAGVKIDPATGNITMPNGSTVSASASPDSLKGLPGFDPLQVDSTLADEKRMEASLLAKAGAGGAGAFSGYQSGGGGSRGGANAVNPNASNDDAMAKYLAGLNGKNRKPGSIKQGVAGLSRKLGSESIGVKGDNIFEMVNRRYQAQDKQNAFLREK